MKFFKIILFVIALAASILAAYELVRVMTTANAAAHMALVSGFFINFVVFMIFTVAGWVGFYAVNRKLKA
jgi:hypothetical protein